MKEKCLSALLVIKNIFFCLFSSAMDFSDFKSTIFTKANNIEKNEKIKISNHFIDDKCKYFG